MKRRAAVIVAVALAAALAVVLPIALHKKPAAHVQVVLASDGSLMVAGVPGRSVRARIQNPSIWDGASPTSMYLTEWLRAASYAEKRGGTYDGRALVIVDDHASFQIAKMLIASARASYPDVSYVDGVVSELPRQHGVDHDKPAPSYLKDCSATPAPAGCAK